MDYSRLGYQRLSLNHRDIYQTGTNNIHLMCDFLTALCERTRSMDSEKKSQNEQQQDTNSMCQ